jgi:hypothetical protein
MALAVRPRASWINDRISATSLDGPSDEIFALSFIQYAFHGSNAW